MSGPQNIFAGHRSDDALNTYNSLLHEADSYISFFKKRCEIEDEFQSQLAKLALRQFESDRKLSSEHHDLGPASARLAWQEITSNVQQEAQLRKNWIRKIREHVIEPLEKFRSIKERTLSRIRDDMRNSVNDHKEYLATVQRLKKQYDRKCEEVNQYYSMVEAIEFRDKLIEDRQGEWEHVSAGWLASPPQSNDNLSHGASPPPHANTTTTRKSGDFTQHFNHLVPSGSTGVNANVNPAHSGHSARSPFIISGATSTALRDTAIPVPANPLQAKGNDVLHALRNNTNNLIQRLNSRKENKAGGGSNIISGPDDGTIRPSALRGSKLKREAEDADRDYRKGVFHLETLRLRKEQVIRGARRATEDMVFETSGEAKDTFAYFIDETRMAAVSRISICDHAQYLVDKISPEDDAHTFSVNQPDEFSEPKVLYENAFTGPCQSLLFGVAINDYYASHPGKGWVPLLVRICIEEIEKRGITLEGIYRVSGKMQNVTQLVHEIEKDEDAFRFDPDRHDPYTIAGVLKLYLRQLPTPLFTFPLVERVAFSNNLEEHVQNGFSVLIKKIRKLPPAHQATLKLVCEHLHRVSMHSEQNKMTSSNLGMVFAPAVFSEETGVQLPPQAWKDLVMEALIDHQAELFEGLPIAEPSGGSGIKTQRGSLTTRPPSPSARKSLEAEQYESYSRSGSPNRPIVTQASMSTPSPQTTSASSRLMDPSSYQPQRANPPQSSADESEQAPSKRSSVGSNPGFQPPQAPHVFPPPVAVQVTTSSLARQNTGKATKRSFSLRKKASPSNRNVQSFGISGATSSRHSFDSHSSIGLDRVSPEHQSGARPVHPEFAVLSRPQRSPSNLSEPHNSHLSPHRSPTPTAQRVPQTLEQCFQSVIQLDGHDIHTSATTISPSTSTTSDGNPDDITNLKSARRGAQVLRNTDVQMPSAGINSPFDTSSNTSAPTIEGTRNSEAVEELVSGLSQVDLSKPSTPGFV